MNRRLSKRLRKEAVACATKAEGCREVYIGHKHHGATRICTPGSRRAIYQALKRQRRTP